MKVKDLKVLLAEYADEETLVFKVEGKIIDCSKENVPLELNLFIYNEPLKEVTMFLREI